MDSTPPEDFHPQAGSGSAPRHDPPRVSVIMATYNGARTIRASVNSILSQTLRDLELIVVDDCSTDDTLAVLATIADPRLRVLRNERNLNVVATRNRCLQAARGTYVAMLDHDDLSLPTRLAKQVAYLEANPRVVLVGTAAGTLQDGVLAEMNHPMATTPALIDWLLHVANPLVCSSVMFRAEAARSLGAFMRENFTYADDYDFYHRMAALGDIARLDERLTIYRLHAGNAYKKYEQIMAENAVKVLEAPYQPLFGDEAREAARLVVNHLSAGRPVQSVADLRQLCRVFNALNSWCLSMLKAEDEVVASITRAALWSAATRMWLRMMRATAKTGGVSIGAMRRMMPQGVHVGARDLALMAASRIGVLSAARGLVRRDAAPVAPPPGRGRLFDTVYEPYPVDAAEAPTLFVVVDTEAEFDWSKPFARELNAVSAMDDIVRGQEIFDNYGLRPIYVIDYPVASQERGYRGLREIMERDGCEIGAHLHPWTTPPFEEDISARNSYPGNLDPRLEERKLASLIEAIRRNFGVAPVFYKAGRYGFGPCTQDALARHGIKVDLSVLPGADLRRYGGPDFSALTSIPYRIGGTDVLTLPMTRASVGLLPGLGQAAARFHAGNIGRALHVPSILARLGVAETITLTPEGVTAAEQIRLLRSMLGQGFRSFVLHYHSPSLGAGHTPYARDRAGAEMMVGRLRDVCRFFFEELGGLPGYPRDLLQVLAPAKKAKEALLS